MPKKKTETTAPAETATPSVATHVTVGGYRVQINAFIPLDKKDLQRQAAVTGRLAAVQAGTEDISALSDLITDPEFKIDYVNRRVLIEPKAEETDTAHDPDYDEVEETATVRDGETGELVDDEIEETTED